MSWQPLFRGVFTGRRREGIYAGAMTFSGKLMRSAIVFVMGSILSFYGFQSKSHTQSESVRRHRRCVLCRGYCLALIAIVFSSQMNLNRKTHMVVLSEVSRIKAGGKISEVTSELHLVMEDLTGHAYEECWGNCMVCKKIFSASGTEAFKTGSIPAK